MPGVAVSQVGRPPLCHSAQMYGPGRTMAWQPFGGDQVEEAAEVQAVLLAPLALDGLVRVPGDVGLDRVEPHEACFADAVGPVAGMDPEIVHRAGDDPMGPAVQQEVAVADGESAHVISARSCSSGYPPASRRGDVPLRELLCLRNHVASA